MQQWFAARSVVLDDTVREFVDRAQEAHARFENQWRGVEWRLARTPEKETPRRPHDPTKYLICVIPEKELATTHELWLLYSYDEDEVVIHWARFGDGHNLNPPMP